VYAVIHKAYVNGATIAGTSAGAAVMSKLMITGKELVGDTSYNATFTKLRDKNLELQEGLGLVKTAIIDQHFIVRSRYNRLLSALAKFPLLPCIGIDEATAIIVWGSKATVAGDSQVIVFRRPKGLQVTNKGLIKFSDVQMSIYTNGDTFLMK
jgi:cyanophycinase